MYYDPPGRATKVKLPNGCIRRVLFDAWKQEFWDENDCAVDSDCTADGDLTAWAATHTETPTKIHLDHLGRPVATEEYAEQEGDAIWTVLTLDVAGNPTAITDARSIVTQAQVFDMLGRPIHSISPDAGNSTVFLDVAGQPLRIWKSGDLQIDFGYDDLRRKTKTLVTEGASTPRLVEVNEYGESEGSTTNHRGRLWRQWDTAGRVEVDAYDFKGNPLSSTRYFMEDAEADIDWSDFDPVAHPFPGDTAADIAVLQDGDSGSNPGAVSVLESEAFAVTEAFDAMNRVILRTTPDGVESNRSYDDGGRLVTVAVDSDDFVEAITYNARGQRTEIQYGNGVTTVYSYEPETFRLSTQISTRASDSKVLQELTYSYDPVGNITGIVNDAEATLYFANTAVTPDQEFSYDALYRLMSATGREKTARGRADWAEPGYGEVPSGSETMQRYTQSYSYDAAGNLTEMSHFVSGGSPHNWTRESDYESGSNRLSETTETGGSVSYQHDARGNIVFWPHLYNNGATPAPAPNVEVTWRDQMRRAQLNATDYALYSYDSGGQRVRKVVYKGANVEERRYVAGWELWRKSVSGSLEEERSTLHVEDGSRRIAMVETETVSGGSPLSPPTARVRYQLDNHLGTSVLEVDESGDVISYEEYHPYGSCAWWAGKAGVEVSRRRYRYTGMERDEETGLACHGWRYYASWLGRWGSADPLGLGDGVNRYGYCHGNPVGGRDPTGMEDAPAWYESVASAGGQLLLSVAATVPNPLVAIPAEVSGFVWDGVETYQDIKTAVGDPSVSNLAMAGVSALGMAADLAPGGIVDAPLEILQAGLRAAGPTVKAGGEAVVRAVKGEGVERVVEGAAEVSGGGRAIHSRYADDTPVFKDERPQRLPAGPDATADGAHSRVRWDAANERVYQTREFDAAGNPVRDVDLTSPTYPNGTLRPDHEPAPHQHPWTVNDPAVGPRSGFQRAPGEPL